VALRVLIFGTYDRGVGRNAILQEALRAAGIEVALCHAPLWRDTADKLAAARRTGRLAGAAGRQAWAWVRLMAAHARAAPYDVLLVGATAHLDLPLAHRLARRRRRPLVFDPLVSISETVRDRGLLRPGSRRLAALVRLERRLFALPDLTLADTLAHAQALAREVGLCLDRAAVVPAGTPSVYRRLARPYVPGPGLRVAYFGQYIPLHGIRTVLDAAARLRHRPDVRFDLVGIGQELAEARAHARRLELVNVRFRPVWLGPEALAEGHIEPADVCLGAFGALPKAARVVPYKVYTALASGRAVLTADTPAVRELLRPGEEVWTVPPADPDALADALARLADDPALRARLARAGQAAYDARFAAGPLGDLLCAALEPLAARQGRQ